MKTIRINEQQIGNLMIFLDRVNIQGLKELQAMNEILNTLDNPVECNCEVQSK